MSSRTPQGVNPPQGEVGRQNAPSPTRPASATRRVVLEEWSTTGPQQDARLRFANGAVDVGRYPDLWKRIDEVNRQRRVEILVVRDGLRVTTTSWVGTIGLGELTLLIRPKIAPEYIPTFVRYALGISTFPPASRTSSPLHETGFLDLLATAFLEEVDAVLAAGLFHDYKQTQAVLTMPRGTPLFSQMALKPLGTRLAVPCRFSHRTPELPLNLLLGAALSAIQYGIQDRRLRFEFHSRATLLQELCGSIPLSFALLAQAKAALDRRTSYYEPAVRFAELLLRGLGSAFTEVEQERLPSFLFDMNALFEQFVARLCREHAPTGLRIETQESMKDAYRYASNPHRWQLPRLRPDIVAYRKTATGQQEVPCLVLDTKYKLLQGKRPSPADLYQLTLYSLAFGREHTVPTRIVFPTLTATAEAAPPRLEFVGLGERQSPASIDLMGLCLPQVARALQSRSRSTLQDIVQSLLQEP